MPAKEVFFMEMSKVPNPARTSKLKISASSGKRLVFIDNIRWVMIALVVILHLACTYGKQGRWYYQEEGVIDDFSLSLFSMFASFTQAYFMGFLFFIAGFFTPGSCDKKGSGRFIWERFLRLGIPALVYMAVLHPLTILVMFVLNHSGPFDLVLSYKDYLTSANFLAGSGPLWFAIALLIFSTIYALLRLAFSKAKPMVFDGKPALITHSRVIAVIALISLCAFLIRLIQPIGTDFFNMQLCFFSQYVILFSLGIVAYRRNLLANLSSNFGRFWFKLALYLGTPFWGVIMFLGGASRDWTPFAGGFHWQAAAYAAWESFFCIGICLGLLVLFRDKYNIQDSLSRFLSENAFGVYVFHTPYW
jgi:hypothetical protein